MKTPGRVQISVLAKSPDNSLEVLADSSAPVRYFLVLPAAGSGRRMHSVRPKQYLQIDGKALLQHTLERLGNMPWFEKIVVVLAGEDAEWPAVAAHLDTALREKLLIAPGGGERFQSVANALITLLAHARPDDWVLVHDAVRPCVRTEDVGKLIAQLQEEPAGGLLAAPVRETLKEGKAGQLVKRTVDREGLWLAATPQMFRFAVLQKALRQVLAEGLTVTDEAAAVELLGLPVRLVSGRADNLKVTYPEDLALVAALLQSQQEEATRKG